MLTVNSVSVASNYNSFIVINWTVAPTIEDTSLYTFNIYNSLSPDTNFSLLVSGLPGFSYKFDNMNKLNSSVHWYFKVEAQDASGNTNLCACVGAMYMVPVDNWASTIIYQYNYFLQNILNRPPVKVLIKRRTGQRCPICWDPISQEVTRSHCPACYSTSYFGGYVYAGPIYISFTEPSFETKFSVADVKDIQSSAVQIWTTNYPLILPGDVIIDDFNRRFRVEHSQPTTKGGRIYLRQVIDMQLIPPTDIIYTFPDDMFYISTTDVVPAATDTPSADIVYDLSFGIEGGVLGFEDPKANT